MVLSGLALVSGPAPASAANGQVSLVSHTPVGPATAVLGDSQSPSSSADGAFVAFQSSATDLVSGQSDANNNNDIFLFERATGAVTLVSHTPASATTTASGISSEPAISSDGAFVAFRSTATNLATGQSDANSTGDIFLLQRATGVVTLVSHTPASATTTANGFSSEPAISADGAFVAFFSFANNLVAGQSDANGDFDIFLLQRATGVVTLVSHTPASATTTANSASLEPAISADGAFVAFHSTATNLVAGQSDANGDFDTFLFERATGVVTLVSHTPASATTTASSDSLGPAISADGAFVAFHSLATNLVVSQSDGNGNYDTFLFQRATGVVALVSHTPASATTASGLSLDPAISADGAFVAFSSTATTLVAGQSDTNGDFDTFLFQRATGVVTLVSHTPASATTTASAGGLDPAISADGAFVAFSSTATNLVAGQSDANSNYDAFLFQRATGVVTLVSHTPASATTTANLGSAEAAISADGAFVPFSSSATNLVAGQSDANGATDVFLFQRSDGAARPPADFDGNGTTDIGVFRPSTGVWYVQGGATTYWGTNGDLPVPGDYNGNGTTEIAVFRRTTGVWYVQGGATTTWGTNGDVPVPGDYNGDGTTEVAVFRPSTGVWYVQGGATTYWGTNGDIPVPGDYNGDGSTEVAVFRPATGVWYVQGGATTYWGTNGDVPVPGDYNGNGTTDIAVFRPATGVWYVQGGATTYWGANGDVPAPGDYNGNGTTDIAVFRDATGVWYVQGGATTTWGANGDVPVPLPYAIYDPFS